MKYCSRIRFLQRSEKYHQKHHMFEAGYLFSSVQYEGRFSSEHSRLTRKVHSISLDSVGNRKVKQKIDPISTDFDCPIPEMPKKVRLYQIFSTTFMFCGTVKYALLTLIHYKWVDIDPIYSCYLPGRVGMMVNYSDAPWFGLFIFSLHALYRSMLMFIINRLQLDCFVFLCYDQDTIIDRQSNISQMNNPRVSPEVAYKKFLCNRVFYEQKVGAGGRISYVMKQNRTIEQYISLKHLIKFIRLSHYLVLFGALIPMYIYKFMTQLDNDIFDRNYPACRSFSNDANNENFVWSFNDRFRIFNLFFDTLDNLMYLLDTSAACVLPISTALILTEDLSVRIDSLCSRISQLNNRFRSFLVHDENHQKGMTLTKVNPLSLRLIESLEKTSSLIFNETINVFKQVQQVDGFLRGFSAFSIYVTFLFDITLQSIIIFTIEPGDPIMIVYVAWEIYLNIFVGIIFVLWARPNNRAYNLYNKLCSSMALCPNAPKSETWQWLLEYYHERSRRYSLHICSKSFPLSTLNFLQCMSWFLTGTFIILNSVKERQQFKNYNTIRND